MTQSRLQPPIRADHLQALGTVAAAIAALIALFVAWDQGRVMREEIRASVWPALQIDGFVSSTPDQINVGLNVQNAGVGPARIDALIMRYEGELIADIEALSALFPAYQGRSVTTATGRLLAAGDSVEVFSFAVPRPLAPVPASDEAGADPDGGEDAVDMMSELARLYEIDVCYCSVLDECWIARSSGSVASPRPQPVDACPVDAISNL